MFRRGLSLLFDVQRALVHLATNDFCEKKFCNVTWLSGQVSLAGLVCSLQCAPSNIKKPVRTTAFGPYNPVPQHRYLGVQFANNCE